MVLSDASKSLVPTLTGRGSFGLVSVILGLPESGRDVVVERRGGVVLEGQDRRDRAHAIEAQLLPATGNALVHVASDRRALTKRGDVLMLFARVHQHLGTPGPLVGWILGGVQPSRPGLSEDID